MAQKVRLIKIASEINIGRETIVEHLINKGFSIENKPTAFLTPEMVDVVYDKFKKELRIAEKQREKVEKMKQGRKSAIEAKEKAETQKIESAKSVKSQQEELIDVPEVQKKKTAPVRKKIDTSMGDLIEEIAPGKAKHTKSKIKEKKTAEPEPVVEPKIQKTEEKSEKSSISKEKVEDVNKSKSKSRKKKITQTEKTEQKQHSKSGGKEFRPKKRTKGRKVAEVGVGTDKTKSGMGLKIVGRVDLDKNKTGKKAPEKRDNKSTSSQDKKPKYKKKFKGTKDKGFPINTDSPEKRKRKRRSIRDSISEEDVNKQIRETLSEMEDSSSRGRKTKLKHKKKAQREEKEQKVLEEKQREEKILKLTEYVTTSDLASMIGVTAKDIILKCMGLGLMVSINQRLEKDTIELIADDYELDVEFIDEKSLQSLEIEDEDEPEELLKHRPPIVTIMGHVDHGKTSLLDFIRKSNIVAGESGGITQHIGAYHVSLDDGRKITFLDTPGHEAFTAMRARGALITDLVVLVVAADDSVMPQTIEAISHAQAANVPIVVAINKIDKEDAQPERIKQQLADYNVLVEEWGGKIQAAEISAKKGINIDTLLEKILLEAEMLEIKANPDRFAKGVIVEAKMDKGLGPIATVIVQKGTLKVGDYFVAGFHWGRVRVMFDERMNKIDKIGPSMPVRVVGFDGLPDSGDVFQVLESEYAAKSIANDRNILKRQQEMTRVKQVTLDELSKQIQEGGIKDLNLLIKADAGGSAEAISDSLMKLSTSEVRVNILHTGVGAISESDVMLAVASGAVVIGFHVNPTAAAKKIADVNSVEIRLYSIIYDCIEDVRLALEGLLTPDLKEEITAEVEIREVFKISKMGKIAGCYVLSGKISRNDKVRVLRDGLPVFTGTMESLKRGKDDTKEVDTGYECGILLNGFNAIEEGDIIQAYKIVEVKRTLS